MNGVIKLQVDCFKKVRFTIIFRIKLIFSFVNFYILYAGYIAKSFQMHKGSRPTTAKPSEKKGLVKKTKVESLVSIIDVFWSSNDTKS